MSDVIKLDDDGLRSFVQEAILQVLKANKDLQCNHNVTVTPVFKIQFSGVVVAKGGLNAVERRSVADGAKQETTQTDEPYVEKTTRTGRQTSSQTESQTMRANESQSSTQKDDTAQASKSSGTEAASNTSSAKTTKTGKGTATSEGAEDTEDNANVQQAQTNGTQQDTTTEYSLP